MNQLSQLLSQVGAPLLGSLLSRVDFGSPIANVVLRRLGEKLQSQPTSIAITDALQGSFDPVTGSVTSSPAVTAVRELEAEHGAEWVQVYQAGVEGQFALAQSEHSQGGLASFWRYGWMYLLAVFWTFALLVVPIVNAIAKSEIAPIDLGILLTLTGWFISLYMGGHTIKELGKNALDAVREWKGRGPI